MMLLGLGALTKVHSCMIVWLVFFGVLVYNKNELIILPCQGTDTVGFVLPLSFYSKITWRIFLFPLLQSHLDQELKLIGMPNQSHGVIGLKLIQSLLYGPMLELLNVVLSFL